MKEELTEKLLRNKKKRDEARAKKGLKIANSQIGMTTRDFKQRSYFLPF
jgi:hypothetical protein